MAQGGFKSGGKSKQKNASSKKSNKLALKKKTSGVTKKTNSGIKAPKRLPEQKAAQLKSSVQKTINKSIEGELSALATRYEEGKAFKLLGNDLKKHQPKNKNKKK